ncbi:MAG: DUF3108 domain-containing protein [Rhodocyclaceae bacterium]|jgi:hypothetical protein|nr:DUF3108 domain-containing protein [Rhodocyclaceae bacterium]
MLPLWLALAASLTLHLGVLLSPGWILPMDGEAEAGRLDATLVPAPVAPSPAATAATPATKKPPRVKRPKPPPAVPPTPAHPQVDVPHTTPPTAEPETVASSAPPQSADVPPAVETASSAEGAVPPAPTFHVRWPRSGRIVYQVSRGEQGFVIGRAEQRWEWDEAHYLLETVAETSGLVALFKPARVVQASRGGFDAAGVRPQEFTLEREGRETERVIFEAGEARIVFSRGGSAPFSAGVQDVLSVFFQLAGLPLDLPEYAVSVATTRKLANYQVTVSDVTGLETPLGMRQARHLTIQGRPGEDVTELWLDEQTRLPLKIRHRDRKSEVFDQMIVSIEPGFDIEMDLPR